MSVEVDEIPPCDMCGEPAAVDGATTLGPWAYMCDADFERHGVGLGTGKGQKLMLRGTVEPSGIDRETAERVRAVIARYLGCAPEAVFMADHNHEEISPGSWSYAYEYDGEQLAEFTYAARDDERYKLPDGIWMERINGFAIAAHKR